jgi:hypothetical protein
MSDRALSTVWIPLTAAVGVLLLGVPLLDLSPEVEVWAFPTAIGLGPALLLIAGILAYKIKSTDANVRPRDRVNLR